MRGKCYRVCHAATLTKGFVLQMLTRDLLAVAKKNLFYETFTNLNFRIKIGYDSLTSSTNLCGDLCI